MTKTSFLDFAGNQIVHTDSHQTEVLRAAATDQTEVLRAASTDHTEVLRAAATDHTEVLRAAATELSKLPDVLQSPDPAVLTLVFP